jgi:hypothetical protein
VRREGATRPRVGPPRRFFAGPPLVLVLALEWTLPASPLYYTTSGPDPRVRGAGTVSLDARIYTAPLRLEAGQVLKSRVYQGGVWSPLIEAAPAAKANP